MRSGDRRGVERPQRRDLEDRPMTDARSRDGALVLREAFEPGGEQRLDGGRDRDRVDRPAAPSTASRSSAPGDRRRAACRRTPRRTAALPSAASRIRARRPAGIAEPPGQRVEQRAGGVRAERLEAQHGRGLAREATADGRRSISSGRAVREEEQRDAGGEVDDVVDEVEQGVLGPVEVLEDDEGGLLVGEVLEEAADGPEQLVLGGAIGRQADGGGDLRATRSPSGSAGDQRLDLGSAPPPASSASVMPGGLVDELADRPVGDALAVAEAAPDEGPATVRRGPAR